MQEKYVKDRAHNRYPAYCCEDIDKKATEQEKFNNALLDGSQAVGKAREAEHADEASVAYRDADKNAFTKAYKRWDDSTLIYRESADINRILSWLDLGEMKDDQSIHRIAAVSLILRETYDMISPAHQDFSCLINIPITQEDNVKELKGLKCPLHTNVYMGDDGSYYVDNGVIYISLKEDYKINEDESVSRNLYLEYQSGYIITHKMLDTSYTFEKFIPLEGNYTLNGVRVLFA